ncbi:hypothetical protein BpHYR1_004587 [Brachionus plicatilis]|uniref:Uncharacterized protein n=1 Tax=Brachionus plicatilis TaxID=10195 RepID=A0A3M7PB30_BRAPC|nr:hypothetical protein BpHYR1_004587 [Brachionus plicatilis]
MPLNGRSNKKIVQNINLRIKNQSGDVFTRHPGQLMREHIFDHEQPNQYLVVGIAIKLIANDMKFDETALLLISSGLISRRHCAEQRRFIRSGHFGVTLAHQLSDHRVLRVPLALVLLVQLALFFLQLALLADLVRPPPSHLVQANLGLKALEVRHVQVLALEHVVDLGLVHRVAQTHILCPYHTVLFGQLLLKTAQKTRQIGRKYEPLFHRYLLLFAHKFLFDFFFDHWKD